MAASAQVNSRMQLNLLACGWFVVVVDDGMAWTWAWTLMLGWLVAWTHHGLDVSWLGHTMAGHY
jgi:hypothetical protein